MKAALNWAYDIRKEAGRRKRKAEAGGKGKKEREGPLI